MTPRELSVVVPAFNSAPYINETVAAILRFFADAAIDGEVVVADDGSHDGTADAVGAAANVRVLRLAHRGKGAALQAGMAAATGEIRAFTDADLPYGTEPLLLAVRYIRERGFHAVIGDRTLPGSIHKNTGPVRMALSKVASFVFRTLVTGGIYDTQCGFKVFRGDVAAEVFRLARIPGFAIDVEVIYLLLTYRLDVKRIPVQLQRSTPSSVNVVRDSLASVRDVVSIRVSRALGRYRSMVLPQLLERELRADVAGAAQAPDLPERSD